MKKGPLLFGSIVFCVSSSSQWKEEQRALFFMKGDLIVFRNAPETLFAAIVKCSRFCPGKPKTGDL